MNESCMRSSSGELVEDFPHAMTVPAAGKDLRPVVQKKHVGAVEIRLKLLDGTDVDDG